MKEAKAHTAHTQGGESPGFKPRLFEFLFLFLCFSFSPSLSLSLCVQVNDTDVATLCHQDVVEAIRNSGDMLSLKVLTLPLEAQEQFAQQSNGVSNGFQNGRCCRLFL